MANEYLLPLDAKWKMSKTELLIFSLLKHLQPAPFLISTEGTFILPSDHVKILAIIFNSFLFLAFTFNSTANAIIY